MTDTANTTTIPITQGTWEVDPAHSSAEFVVRHLGLSKVRGRFNTFSATLQVGQSLAESRLSATVDLASVDTNNPDRDAHLRSTDFFHVDEHPQMVFESTSIDGSDDEYSVTGDLTINGITHPITLDVEFNGVQTSPSDQRNHAGFSASGSLSRKEYGVEFEIPLGADKVTIGDKVRIELEVQFVEPV